MYGQLGKLTQGIDTVVEYMVKFDELVAMCNLNEDPWLTLNQFKGGLRNDIRKALMFHSIGSYRMCTNKLVK